MDDFSGLETTPGSTVFEMNVESYRRRSALEVKRQRGRPASFATIKGNDQFVAERQLENDQTLVSDNQRDTFTPTAT